MIMSHKCDKKGGYMNLDLLEAKMNKLKISKEGLAEALGIDRSTVYRKLSRNGEPFTIKEAREIQKILNLSKSEAISIFFD